MRSYHEKCVHELHVCSMISGLIDLILISQVHEILSRSEIVVFGIAVFMICVYCVWTLLVVKDYLHKKMPRTGASGTGQKAA